MICYEKQKTSKASFRYNLRSCCVDDWNYLRHFDNQINTGMNTVRFLRIFFAYLGTPCWYEGIDKPTMYQRLWGWRIGPVMAWRLARITM